MDPSIVPETQLQRSLSAGSGLDELSHLDAPEIAIRGMRPISKAKRKEDATILLSKIISVLYLPRDVVLGSQNAPASFTNGVTARSIVALLNKILCEAFFRTEDAAPSGFNVALIRKLFEQYGQHVSQGTMYNRKHYVTAVEGGLDKEQIPCAYGGRVVSTEDDFDALAEYLLSVPSQALHTSLREIVTRRGSNARQIAREFKSVLEEIYSLESVLSAKGSFDCETVHNDHGSVPAGRVARKTSTEIVQDAETQVFELASQLKLLGRLEDEQFAVFATTTFARNRQLLQVQMSRAERLAQHNNWTLTDEDKERLALLRHPSAVQPPLEVNDPDEDVVSGGDERSASETDSDDPTGPNEQGPLSKRQRSELSCRVALTQRSMNVP